MNKIRNLQKVLSFQLRLKLNRKNAAAILIRRESHLEYGEFI